MNEQDKQAFDAAWEKAVLELDGVNRDDFEDGWQAALEYARGHQEPVAWLCEWDDWHQYHDAKDPLPNEWDDAPDKITPLYTHPAQPVQPAVAQGEILFEAGKAAGRQEVKDAQSEPDFWAWVHKAYREPESTNFTIHNMEVAYQAGRVAAEAEKARGRG